MSSGCDLPASSKRGGFSGPKGSRMITSASGARLGRAGAAALLAAAFSLSAAPASAVAAATASATVRPATSQATVPPGRAWASFAYDAVRYQLVLFGGGIANTVYGDTWTWNDNSWTEQHPARSPSARIGAAMVYDPATR